MNHEPFVESTHVRPSTRFTATTPRVSTAAAGARSKQSQPLDDKRDLTIVSETSGPSLDSVGILRKPIRMVNKELVRECKDNGNKKA